MNRGLRNGLAAALLVLGTAGAGSAPLKPAVVTTTIGGLFFAHDPAEWRVGVGDDTALISCLAETCLDAVVEVYFTPNGKRCDERTALRAAEVAFPAFTNRTVNMYGMGGLAIYVASSRMAAQAFDPNIGPALYACLDRDGVQYEFLTRVGDDPIPGGQEWAVFAVLGALSAPPAPLITTPLGALAIVYPADRWTPSAAMTPNGPTTLFCLPPTCEGIVPLHIEVAPVTGAVRSCFSEGDIIPEEQRGIAEANRMLIPTTEGGLALEYVAIQSLCRARTPPHFGACVIHDGVRYSFWTGTDFGCDFGPHIGDDAFLDLVQSLRPVTAP